MRTRNPITVAVLQWLLPACLLAASAFAGAVQEGPPFPRIANTTGVWLDSRTPGGLYRCGEPAALEEIARYDLILGVHGPWDGAGTEADVQEGISALKRLNPHMLVLDHAGSADCSYDPPPPWERPHAAVPDTAWLLQTDGKRIASWPGRFVLNMTRPETIDWLAQLAGSGASRPGFDGAYLTGMCPGLQLFEAVCEAASGKASTLDADHDGQSDDITELNAAVTAAKEELAGRARELAGEEAVLVGRWPGDYAFEHLNGAYLNQHLQILAIGGYPEWQQLLAVYLRWTRTPRTPNVTILGDRYDIGPPHYPNERSPDAWPAGMTRSGARERRMRFGLTTALMGDGYYSFESNSFDVSSEWEGRPQWFLEFDAPLGYPRGLAASFEDGTWRREFEGGLVVVNPTPWDVRVALDRKCRDVSSGAIGTASVLPGWDGRIFLPTDEPERPGSFQTALPLLTRSGPAGAEARQDGVVVRWPGGTAFFDPDGTLRSLWSGGEELVVAVRQHTSIRNVDLVPQGIQNTVNADGSVTITGQRSDGHQLVRYTQEVRAVGQQLSMAWSWQALTPLSPSGWRTVVDVPVSTFAGGRLTYGGQTAALTEASGEALLAASWTRPDEAVFLAPSGAAIRVGKLVGRVVDSRVQEVGSSYRVVGNTMPTDSSLPAGAEWSYTITLTPGQQ